MRSRPPPESIWSRPVPPSIRSLPLSVAMRSSPGAGVDRVRARPGRDPVVAVAAVDRVEPRAAVDLVVAGAAADRVVAGVAGDRVDPRGRRRSGRCRGRPAGRRRRRRRAGRPRRRSGRRRRCTRPAARRRAGRRRRPGCGRCPARRRSGPCRRDRRRCRPRPWPSTWSSVGVPSRKSTEVGAFDGRRGHGRRRHGERQAPAPRPRSVPSIILGIGTQDDAGKSGRHLCKRGAMIRYAFRPSPRPLAVLGQQRVQARQLLHPLEPVRDRVPVGVDRRGGRVHVAVALQVRATASRQVGRVLRVVGDQRARPCPRRTSAPPRGARRARGRAGGRCRCRCPRRSGRRSGAGRRARARPPGSPGRGRPRRRRTTTRRRSRAAAAARPAGAPRPASPRRPPRRRPAAARRRGRSAAVHVLGQRARVLARDRRHDVPRAVRGQLRAQRHGAAREIAAEPGGAPQHVVGLEVVAPAQLLQERAAQVLLDLQPRLFDGDLGQARDGGDVQELERVGSRLVVAEQQHGAQLLVARGDRHLGRHARRHRRRAGTRPLADVPAQRRQIGDRRRRPPPRRGAARRSPRRHRSPTAASAATPSSPSPLRTASTIRRCTALHPVHHGGPRSPAGPPSPRSIRLLHCAGRPVGRPAQIRLWPGCL